MKFSYTKQFTAR